MFGREGRCWQIHEGQRDGALQLCRTASILAAERHEKWVGEKERRSGRRQGGWWEGALQYYQTAQILAAERRERRVLGRVFRSKRGQEGQCLYSARLDDVTCGWAAGGVGAARNQGECVLIGGGGRLASGGS